MQGVVVLLLCCIQLSIAADKPSSSKKIKTTRPYIVGNSRQYEHVGGNVSFGCAHRSDSILTWWFDGQPIWEGGRLVLTNITQERAGIYTCRSVDPLSRRSFTVSATLYVPNPACVAQFTHNRPQQGQYYQARWWPADGHIVFDIEANAVAAKHWVGVGFSRDGELAGSDLIVGWVEKEGDRFRIQDRHIGADGEKLALDRNQTGLSLIYGRTAGGVTRIQFRRKADLGDEQDANLTDCHYFFYLWRGQVLSPAKIRPHRHALRSDIRICPVKCPDKDEDQRNQLVISQSLVEMEATINEDITLPFQISGTKDSPNITLSHNGKSFLLALFGIPGMKQKMVKADRISVTYKGEVTIAKPVCSDAGIYMITASNKELTQTAQINVRICKGTEIVSQSRVLAKNRLKALLTLKSEGRIAFWKKDGKFLLPTERIKISGKTLTIGPVFYYDSGKYTLCFTKSNSNASDQCACTCEEIELVVREFPKVHVYSPLHLIEAKRHRHCHITCIVKGFPKPEQVWMRNGFVFYPQSTNGFRWRQSSGRLSVPCWEVNDTAKYTCMANNDAGTDSKSVYITVLNEMTQEDSPTKPTLYQILRQQRIHQHIQAQHSLHYVLLNIRNQHSNPIDILWINYEGIPMTVQTVQPNVVYKMFSYRTHPILAVDSLTGHFLTIAGRFPFFPNPVWEEDVNVCSPYASPVDDHYRGDLRSPGYSKVVYVAFRNLSPRPIDLIWIHMNGSMMMVDTVAPGFRVNYKTYESDLWIARDAKTGRNALINNVLVYKAPNEDVSDVNVSIAKSCGDMQPPQEFLRDSFFVFGCKGIHVVDAHDAYVNKFIAYNTSILVGKTRKPMCVQTTESDPSTHGYEKASSTHEWVGKTRSGYKEIAEELTKTGMWKSSRYPNTCPRCNMCQWGKPARACGKYIYVPEAATRRVYVIDVATEEVIEAIQLKSVPYKVQFVERREEIWIHAYNSPSLMVIKSACHNDAKVVMAADERPNKVVGYNVVVMGNGIRGRTDTALVTSPHDARIWEFNMENLKFGTVGIDTSVHGCLNTFGMAYSPLNGHSFVSCFKHNGKCPLLEINTLNMQLVNELDMPGCGYSYVTPDGQYVITIPMYNPDIPSRPDIAVHRVANINGNAAMLHDVIPVNDSIGYYFASKPSFMATPTSWDVYFTFKALDKVLKVSLEKSVDVKILNRFGDMMCPDVAGKQEAMFSVGGVYARFMDVANPFAGRYFGTPAWYENRFVVWDAQEEKMTWIDHEEMELPYHVVATGP